MINIFYSQTINKSTCLSTKIGVIEGVAFINTKKLNVTGESIQKCLFIQVQSTINQAQLLINSKFTENIVKDFINLKIIFKNETAFQNIFINLRFSEFVFGNIIRTNLFYSCKIIIELLPEYSMIELSGLQAFNCRLYFIRNIEEIKIVDPRNIDFKITDNSILYNIDELKIDKIIKNFQIQNSVILQTNLINERHTLINSITINNSIFEGNNEIKNLFILQQSSSKIQDNPFEINIQGSWFSGFTGSIFIELINRTENQDFDNYMINNQNNDNFRIAVSNSEIRYNILWVDNTYINSSNQTSPFYFFSLDQVLLAIKDKKTDINQYAFEKNNLTRAHRDSYQIEIPIINGKNKGNNIFKTEIIPAQFQILQIYQSQEITSIQSLNLNNTNISQYYYSSNESEKTIFFKEEEIIQIFNGYPLTIQLDIFTQHDQDGIYSYQNDYLMESFKISLVEVSQNQTLDNDKHKKIIFKTDQRTISNVKVLIQIREKQGNIDNYKIFESKKQEMESFQQDQSDTYKQNENQQINITMSHENNSLSFRWKVLPKDFISFIIEIRYCKKGQLIDLENNNICVDSCNENQQRHPFHCSVDCGEGYYQWNEDDRNCLKCDEGCKICNQFQCYICLENLVWYNKTCIRNCPKGMYSNEFKCLPCMDNCEYCDKKTSCQKCLTPNTNNKCEQCDINSYKTDSSCSQCNERCEECQSSSMNLCRSCKQNYKKIFGICQTFSKQNDQEE